MNDQISRQKLIEDIEREFDGVCTYDVSPSQAVSDFIEIVDRQPPADQWIPCSEQLPNKTDNVLITTQYGVILTVFRGMSGNWCYLDGRRLDSQDTPVAWMPLPEPYKGE